MKILFICPHRESIGVGYLSACLKKAGHKTEAIIDPTLFHNNQLFSNRLLDNLFSYENLILDEIRNKNVGLIGFIVFHDDFHWACNLANKIKKIKPRIPIIFGGLHPTLVPEEVIKVPSVDMLCIGEGEEPIVELVDSMEREDVNYKIENIWFKNKGRIIRNPIRPLIQDLDSRSFWDRDIFLNRYSGDKRYYPTITARHCPHSCSYCNNTSLKKIYEGKGKFLRRRSPKNVISELKEAKRKYDIKAVLFYDQNFNYDIKWLEEFSPLYKKEINSPFFCFAQLDTNEKGVFLLKSAGCRAINVGIESVYEKTRQGVLNRYISTEKMERAIALFNEAKIYISANVIFGLPSQTEQEMVDTAKFFIKNKVDLINICWLRYYPKTEILNLAKRRGLLTDKQIDKIERGIHIRGINEGDTFEPKYRNLQNFIIILNFMPKKLALLILKRKYYKFFPSLSSVILKFTLGRFFRTIDRVVNRKQPIDDISYFKFYTYFILKRIFHSLNLFANRSSKD